MPRRLAIRLALALLGLVVALVGGLAVLIAATSAPVLPPPPLPTATAQPGPQTTSIVSALALPTATPQPRPLAQPGMRSGLGADPNGAVRSLIGADPASDIAADDTVYRDSAHPRVTDPPCDPGGQWSLQVDPENVVGYPYSRAPSAADWDRAATVVDTVTSLCPAPIVLSWYAHDKARPSSDRWTALLRSPPRSTDRRYNPTPSRMPGSYSRWAMGDGRWAMGDGRWAMGDGRWAMGDSEERTG